MQKHSHSRSTFSGKIGFVLSAAGASVGLGNIWRFPYLAAKYGGGIFLLIYILLALTFGISIRLSLLWKDDQFPFHRIDVLFLFPKKEKSVGFHRRCMAQS